MSAGLLERPVITPVTLGPTWVEDAQWDGADESARYILPEITLGWQILAWIEQNLLADDSTPDNEKPFRCTFEQKRFILWWYALDENGRFSYRKGMLQRLKGWGKDPLAAVLTAVEFVGPCRFDHWATPITEKPADLERMDLEYGDPVGKPHPRAWIQIAAVSKDQTRNTMTLFPGLFSKACLADHNIDLGKEIIYAYGGSRRIEAVTSSPRALEGGRPTFVILNETHHWLANNEGHAMAAVIDRNLVKAKGGQARSLSITNAYEPSEDSVAQHQREAWENENAGLTISTGVLYDSIEAPPDARMSLEKRPDGTMPTDEEIKLYIATVIEAVRGDATWLDIDTIVAAILDANNPVSQSRRFYYNQIVAAEDAWLDPQAAQAAVDELARDARAQVGADPLRCGWLVMPSEEIVAFFDGSKSDDATALVGCRLSDGYVFTLGVWQKPAGEAGKGWVVPRHEVDNRVEEIFDRFNVVAFWGDPSHAKDDDSSRFWDGLMDDWHRRFKDGLRYWSIKTGDRQHAVMWDMTSPERTKMFVAAAETFVEELEVEGAGETRFDPVFRIDGHPALMDHLRNAKKYPMRDGVSLWKGHRESAKKVDLAVAAVGARMLRRLVLNKGVEEEKKRGGAFWGA